VSKSQETESDYDRIGKER